MESIILDYFEQASRQDGRVCEAVTPGALCCQTCFQQMFFNGNRVRYDCEIKRQLYILRYLPVHVAENREGLAAVQKHYPELLDHWFTSGRIRVLSLGGGPGTDMYATLGMLRAWCNIWTQAGGGGAHQIQFDVTRVDVEAAWDDIAQDLAIRGLCGLNVNLVTVHEDVSNGLDNLGDAEFDIVTMSYLVSELSDMAAQNLVEALAGKIAHNGVLIINDRSEDVVLERIDNIYRQLGMEFDRESLDGRHAGFHYPNEIAEVMSPGPKRWMKSTIHLGVSQ